MYYHYLCFTPIFFWAGGGGFLVAIPAHVMPSPIHPGAQSHLKLPAVLVQVACLWQLWAPISHSFISDTKKETGHLKLKCNTF